MSGQASVLRTFQPTAQTPKASSSGRMQRWMLQSGSETAMWFILLKNQHNSSLPFLVSKKSEDCKPTQKLSHEIIYFYLMECPRRNKNLLTYCLRHNGIPIYSSFRSSRSLIINKRVEGSNQEYVPTESRFKNGG